MMGSSIKNSNVEATISQNPVEALRCNHSVAQSSHKGLIKNTGITEHGEGLLCQGLSLDKAQALFNANDRVSKAGREVIDASATRTNTDVSITNDNENVDFKLHNSPMTSEVLSNSLFNVGNLSNYHLKAGNLSESHVHKLSDSHAFLASSSSDDNLSLSDSQALLPFKLSGILSFKCYDLSLLLLSSDELSGLSKCDDLSLVSSDKLSGFSKGDDLSLLFKCDDLSLSFKFDDPVTLPFVLSGSASSTVSGDLSEVSTVSGDLSEVSTVSSNLLDASVEPGLSEVSTVSSNLLDASVESGDLSGLSGNLSDSYHASGLEPCRFSPSQVVRDLVESDSYLSALMSDDLEDTNKNTTSAVFNKHVVKFVGNHEYVQDSEDGEVETPT
jgi:hypothetical protein